MVRDHHRPLGGKFQPETKDANFFGDTVDRAILAKEDRRRRWGADCRPPPARPKHGSSRAPPDTVRPRSARRLDKADSAAACRRVRNLDSVRFQMETGWVRDMSDGML